MCKQRACQKSVMYEYNSLDTNIKSYYSFLPKTGVMEVCDRLALIH